MRIEGKGYVAPRLGHGSLLSTVVFEENYENLKNLIFLKTLLLRISQLVYKKYHVQKRPKICTGCAKFIYITVDK